MMYMSSFLLCQERNWTQSGWETPPRWQNYMWQSQGLSTNVSTGWYYKSISQKASYLLEMGIGSGKAFLERKKKKVLQPRSEEWVKLTQNRGNGASGGEKNVSKQGLACMVSREKASFLQHREEAGGQCRMRRGRKEPRIQGLVVNDKEVNLCTGRQGWPQQGTQECLRGKPGATTMQVFWKSTLKVAHQAQWIYVDQLGSSCNRVAKRRWTIRTEQWAGDTNGYIGKFVKISWTYWEVNQWLERLRGSG